jgi:hypothetical protein
MCRKSSGVYYWIPTAYKEQFFNLALATTVMRPAAPPDYFANTVVDAQPISANGTKSRTAVKFGTAMQNGAGQMEVVINGVARRFPLYTYQAPLDVPNPPGATIPLPGLTAGPPGAAAPPAGATAGAASPTAARPGDNTVWFEVMYDQKDVPVPPDQFLAAMKAGNVPAKVYLDFFKPASALTQTVKAIQDDTTQLRTQGATH